MGYWISYYFKKFWYLFLLILVLIFIGVILFLNRGDLSTIFEPFSNKVSFEPDRYVEEDFDKEYLNELVVGVPYLGTHSRDYIPSSINEGTEEEEYLRRLKNDPELMYRKNISWASGSITQKQFDDLAELVGYHLNKNSNSTAIIVSTPSAEQLEEYGQEVIYYTDKKGTLYLNLYVEEFNESANTKKSYCYTYRLNYDMEGKINIR